MNKNAIICNNCGKQGHMFHQCKLPITSYGIILFRYSELGIQFLMIRRKHSLSYIEFIRGRYDLNYESILELFNLMSVEEVNKIKNNTFDFL